MFKGWNTEYLFIDLYSPLELLFHFPYFLRLIIFLRWVEITFPSAILISFSLFSGDDHFL